MPNDTPATPDMAFCCGDVADFVALQLARRIDDRKHIHEFAAAAHHGIDRLFAVLQRSVASSEIADLGSRILDKLNVAEQ